MSHFQSALSTLWAHFWLPFFFQIVLLFNALQTLVYLHYIVESNLYFSALLIYIVAPILKDMSKHVNNSVDFSGTTHMLKYLSDLALSP